MKVRSLFNNRVFGRIYKLWLSQYTNDSINQRQTAEEESNIPVRWGECWCKARAARLGLPGAEVFAWIFPPGKRCGASSERKIAFCIPSRFGLYFRTDWVPLVPSLPVSGTLHMLLTQSHRTSQAKEEVSLRSVCTPRCLTAADVVDAECRPLLTEAPVICLLIYWTNTSGKINFLFRGWKTRGSQVAVTAFFKDTLRKEQHLKATKGGWADGNPTLQQEQPEQHCTCIQRIWDTKWSTTGVS